MNKEESAENPCDELFSILTKIEALFANSQNEKVIELKKELPDINWLLQLRAKMEKELKACS